MALPDTYHAIVVDQQRQLAKLINSAGLAPTRKLYQKMLDEVERKLRKAGAGTFTHTQLRGSLAQIKLGLAGILRQMAGKVGEAAYEIGLHSARATLLDVAKLEKHYTGVLIPIPVLEAGRLHGIVVGETSSLMKVHETSMARYGVHLIGRMEGELGAAIASGDSHAEAIDRIQKVGDMEWWRAERIVRTELAYASSASQRAALHEQAGELEGDLWTRWNEHVSDTGAPLDDRVGVDSIAMHGQVAPPGGSFTQPPSTPTGEQVGESLVGETWEHPPNRPNDRSVLMPWRAHWGIPGWIWRGRRVPVTAAMAAKLSAAWFDDQ